MAEKEDEHKIKVDEQYEHPEACREETQEKDYEPDHQVHTIYRFSRNLSPVLVEIGRPPPRL